jgi:hypothetical protein
MDKTMMLVTSAWGNKKTFRLIPAASTAPYNEAIYDPEVKVLAIIGKEKKDNFQMMPKLNEFGDPQILKIGKRQNGKDYAETRLSVETYYEYYVENKDEIVDIINMFAINSDSFDYQTYLNAPVESTDSVAPAPESIITV